MSKIYFEEDVIFDKIEQGFEATRYHSLIVEEKSLTKDIKPLAHTKEIASPLTNHPSLLMALKHKDYPIYGVQFHPEAILTQYGKKLLYNFVFRV